ncbi:hypothetical protein HK099_006348 [Clydaea vesicula]|uniref:F-box domain-containing protein n=1 Tax=Clydaea vesicula TaxID=447962 RepID=A0AAD5U7F7_9FUNG|nr:hypothetical protein HK099_006348 [Clydaea vesicula]
MQSIPSEISNEILSEFRLMWVSELSEKNNKLKTQFPDCKDDSGIGNAYQNVTPAEKEKALKLYKLGADNEYEGNLSSAIAEYRKALKIDPSVEETYRNYILKFNAIEKARKEKELQKKILHQATKELNQTGNVKSSKKQSDNICNVDFILFPNEIISNILKFVLIQDFSAFESLSSVNKHFNSLVHEQSMFRWLSEHVHSYFNNVTNKDFRIYNNCWKNVLLTKPRIRFNGCYISRLNYFRHGFNEALFNQPIHIISYFRYIRFFKNNSCLFFTTTLEPKKVVTDILNNNNLITILKELSDLYNLNLMSLNKKSYKKMEKDLLKELNRELAVSSGTSSGQVGNLLFGSWEFKIIEVDGKEEGNLSLNLLDFVRLETKFFLSLSIGSSRRRNLDKLNWINYHIETNGNNSEIPLNSLTKSKMLADIIHEEFMDDSLDVLDDSDNLETRVSELEEKNALFEEKKALGEIAFGFESWVSKALVETQLPSDYEFDIRDLLDTFASMKEPRLVDCHQVDTDILQTKDGLIKLIEKYLKNGKAQSFGKAILNALCSDGINSEKNIICLASGIYE